MLERTPTDDRAASSLLGTDDPPVFEVLNADGQASLMLICDHASRAIPKVLGDLGVDAAHLGRHVAWDIGAGGVARGLSERLDAPAVIAGYSRLVIDMNRQPGDPESIPTVSDDIAVPGNQELSEADAVDRVETFFWPYHHAITNTMAHLWRRGTPPLLLSVHSFTPELKGDDRPWDIGVLWNRDPRLAMPLFEVLSARGDIHVGNNEPYSGFELAYSIDLHGGAAGIPNCAVEIRQDRVDDDAGVARWIDILDEAMAEILAREEIYQVEHYHDVF